MFDKPKEKITAIRTVVDENTDNNQDGVEPEEVRYMVPGDSPSEMITGGSGTIIRGNGGMAGFNVLTHNLWAIHANVANGKNPDGSE